MSTPRAGLCGSILSGLLTGGVLGGFVLAGCLLAGCLVAEPSTGAAEPAVASHAQIPVPFNPDYRIPMPEGDTTKTIRFLTTDDFPPFHFALPDGTLAGFDIDLVRAICRDLKIACTIQARRFEGLIDEIKKGSDDAVVAAIANNAETRKTLLFGTPYYTTPARFVAPLAQKDATSPKKPPLRGSPTPDALKGRLIGVEAGTSREAYLKTFFPGATIKSYRSGADLHAALQQNEVEAIFADAIASSQWLNSAEARGCCAFFGGPFTESRFFGNGVSIGVAREKVALRQLLDAELDKLVRDGTYADLYLKYFPISFY